MTLADRLDDIGKPAWIAVTVLGFILCWPVGLVILGYLFGSGRIMGCWSSQHYGPERWQRRMERWQRGVERMQQGLERMQQRAAQWTGPIRSSAYPSSGNRAFDEYREETLRRLEDEQREFLAFLDRLRHAKDKAEFDQFMAERRGAGPSPQPGY
jgi:hypothetical protein